MRERVSKGLTVLFTDAKGLIGSRKNRSTCVDCSRMLHEHRCEIAPIVSKRIEEYLLSIF